MKHLSTLGHLAVAALAALPVAGHTALVAPFADQGAAMPATPTPSRGFWQAFDDPGLDQLMARLDADNTTIAAAAARLSLARAHAALGRAESAPQLTLSTSGNYAGGPLINAAGGSGTLFTGALGASWEPDLFGRLAPSRRADRAEIRAAEADQAAIRLAVEANAARAWFAAITFAEAQSQANQVLALAREDEKITAARFARGLCSHQMIEERARAVAAAEDRVALLARSEIEARDMLGYLVGDRSAIAAPTSRLPLPLLVPEGLTAALVERRPDVAAAIARVEVADERHTAARRSWLPRFGLTATGGTASNALTSFLAGGVGSFGLGLLAALPVFDGGAYKARVAAADSAKQLAKAQLRETLLAAYRETHDALAGIAQARSALAAERSRSEIASAEAVRAHRAVERGSLSRSALLRARIAELEGQIACSLRQYDAIDAQLTLLMALGGEWTTRPV